MKEQEQGNKERCSKPINSKSHKKGDTFCISPFCFVKDY